MEHSSRPGAKNVTPHPMRKIPFLLMRDSVLIVFVFCCSFGHSQTRFNGPLRVDTKNPRYFTDNSGRIIYLTGSHTWENLQDMLIRGDKPFDYASYLQMMESNGHNFIRLWMFEQPQMASWTADTVVFDPLPFARTGQGLARDGKPKFDLTKYDPAYFSRLRQRVIEAGRKNIYVSVTAHWRSNVHPG